MSLKVSVSGIRGVVGTALDAESLVRWASAYGQWLPEGPVVVARDGRPWVAIGASGGRRIMPAVAQLISFLTDYGCDLETALALPRINATGDGRATVDPCLPAAMRTTIAAAIDTVDGEHAVYPVLYASPQAVMRDGKAGLNIGAADPALPWSGAVAESV